MSSGSAAGTAGGNKKKFRSPPQTRGVSAARRRKEEADEAILRAAEERYEEFAEAEEAEDDAEDDYGLEDTEDRSRPNDGGHRASRAAKRLLGAMEVKKESATEQYFALALERKPQTYADRRMMEVLQQAEMPSSCSGSPGVANPLMWKHGDLVLRLIVDGHLEKSHLRVDSLHDLMRAKGRLAERSPWEDKVKKHLRSIFFEGTSMEHDPPKGNDMYWALENLVSQVDSMVRFQLFARENAVQTSENMFMHATYWRTQYTYNAEKLEGLVFKKETGKDSKPRAVLFDTSRYLPARRKMVEGFAK